MTLLCTVPRPLHAKNREGVYGIVYEAGWRPHRLGRKHRGFYPSASALGNGFQTLQLFAQPEVRYVLREKETENAAEDDEDDLEHPEKFLGRQLQRIRNGEEIEVLRVRTTK